MQACAWNPHDKGTCGILREFSWNGCGILGVERERFGLKRRGDCARIRAWMRRSSARVIRGVQASVIPMMPFPARKKRCGFPRWRVL